jgi:DNA gyrase subunit B
MHGVGIAAVNALSERFEIETTYRGIRWTQSFERGKRTSALRRIGPSSIEGTTVRLRPDPTIFSTIELDHVRIEARLQELAWLNPHLRVYFQEQRLHARGGIAGWARMLASERGLGIEWHSLARNIRSVGVNVAFAWNRNGAPLVRSFVNMQPTTAGTHVQGLWLGLADYARGRKARARTVEHVREAIGCGLVAVLDVGMYDARFGSPTRDQLCSPEAAKAVRAAVRDALSIDDGRTWHLRRFLDARLHVRNL